MKSRFSDTFYETVILRIGNKQLEFQTFNRANPKHPQHNFFTYEEALEIFKNPNADGWRLPTKEEMNLLVTDYRFQYYPNNDAHIGKLVLPVEGFFGVDNANTQAGYLGSYWTSTEVDSDSKVFAWSLRFSFDSYACVTSVFKKVKMSVRLVREV